MSYSPEIPIDEIHSLQPAADETIPPSLGISGRNRIIPTTESKHATSACVQLKVGLSERSRQL
jgi:hypothetical protein